LVKKTLSEVIGTGLGEPLIWGYVRSDSVAFVTSNRYGLDRYDTTSSGFILNFYYI